MFKRLMLLVVAFILVMAFATGCSGESTEATSDEPEQVEETDEATDDESVPEEFTITSSAYEDGGQIPAKYCNTGVDGGENISIPFAWQGGPDDVMSYALMIVDHHEIADEWIHWAVVDIPPSTMAFAEGESGSLPHSAWELNSTNGASGYQGPQPPAGSGDHEYETFIFALDVESIEISEDPTFGEFLDAMDPHHIGEASISGFFGR